MNGLGNLPYKTTYLKITDLIKQQAREPLSDYYSVEIRHLVDEMLNIDMNKRISMKQIFQKSFVKEQIYHLLEEYPILK